MERSTVGNTSSSTVTVSLSQKVNNLYLRPGVIGTHQENLSRNATTATIDDSAEISIFDAEKYFNELTVLEAPKPAIVNGGNRVSPAENIAAATNGVGVEPQRFSSASSSVDGYSSFYRNYRTRSFRSAATPTVSSEASWNSQTGLLSVPPGSMAVSLRSPLERSAREKKTRDVSSPTSLPSPATPVYLSWRLGLRKKCPCFCKKSVQIKDKSVPRQPAGNALPPPPSPPLPRMILRGNSKSSTTSSMAEIRTANSTTISMDKVHKDPFQESWYQPRRSRSDARDTRSFSSTTTDCHKIIPPKLQAMGIRTSFPDQRVGNEISTGNSSGNTNGFTFPILNVKNAGIKLKDPAMEAISTNSTTCPVEDPARHSLEVFRPSHEQPSSRKTSDHFMRSDQGAAHQPTAFAFPASPHSKVKSSNVDMIDDGASDASSDLFEIESFSTQTTTTATTVTTTAKAPPPAMFLYRRDSMEEAACGGNGGGPSSSSSSFQGLRGGRFAPVMGLYEQHRRASLDEPITPTTECCYEPSEASIDWSVTTAEGFDRASLANPSEADYSEFAALEPPPPPPPQEKSRRRSSGNGLLMSCRCEKAVSVGQPVPRPMRPVGTASGAYAGEHGRKVGPGISLSSSSTLAMWAVGHKL